MIFDFRMSIFDLFRLRPRTGGFSRCYCNRRELVGFLKQRVDSRRVEKSCGNDHLEPEAGFIRFFFDDARFMDEVRFGLRSTKGTIICRNRASASYNLISDYISAAGPREGISQLKDSQCKRFGPFFHFVLVHSRL